MFIVVILLLIPFISSPQSSLWQLSDNGFSLININVIKSDTDGNVFASGTNTSYLGRGMNKSIDNGLSWINIADIDPRQFEIAPNGYLFICTISSETYRSIDHGNSWQFINDLNLPGLTLNFLSFENPKAFFAQFWYHTKVTGPSNLYYSLDTGKTWTYAQYDQDDITHYEFIDINLTSFAISGNNVVWATDGNRVFLATSNYSFYDVNNLPNNSILNLYGSSDSNEVFLVTGAGIYQSRDTGSSWTQILNHNISYFRANKSGSFFAATVSGLFISSDKGVTWNKRGFENITIKNVEFGESNTVVVNSNQGLFLSNNLGESWSVINSNLPDSIITSITINKNGYLFVVVDNKIYRSIKTVQNVTDMNSFVVANDFKLSQNYPNPFNPNTRIKYSILNGGAVSLKIYDILGREIETLVNGYQNPGSYEVEFTPRSLSDGVYFYRLQAGDRSLIKKMIYLK
jgi:photosystem II stability/assembly factor-like uncharacterized protein